MEAVQVYGDSGYPWCKNNNPNDNVTAHGGDGARSCTEQNHSTIDRGTLKGPFYCGMSTVLKMSQFHIHLLSPTSTSIHIQVALKFGGESGIIMELNNDQMHTKNTRAFDVSFLSRYKEEDER